jgi:hypothetical protein
MAEFFSDSVAFSYLAVYRDYDDQVNFIELSAMSYFLLHTLQEQPAITIANWASIQAKGDRLSVCCRLPGCSAFVSAGSS